ncbi:CBN-CYK-4 protein [Caenorhabditis brenneri]|uniref:CBN-CYK-4 protein n=1 Tax=Caenorhabditis brenneri TaxID=135651 RepID=G0ML50_CAEBE|nr:CBN-CYK-4 protein [Caenorhabditis brenneri]
MKSSTSKEKLCGESSRQMYNMIINSQQRFDVKDIGMFHLIDEIERLRKLWKDSEESKKRLNAEMRETEEALAKARKKLALFDIDVKDTQKHMRALMEENKALKLDLNVFETREKQLKEAMKNGIFNSLTKEDRDQFQFLHEPLVRTYSKRVQQRHPHLMEETLEEADDSEVDYDVTGDSFEEVITLRNGREVRRSSAAGNPGGAKRRSASAHAASTAAANSKRSRSRVMAATIDEEPNDGGTPPKRYRDEGAVSPTPHQEVTTTTTTTTTTTVHNSRQNQPRISLNRQLTRRSLSCGSIPSCETPGQITNNNGMGMSSAILTKSTLDIRTLKRGTPAWTNGTTRDIAMRQHTFMEAGIKAMRKCDKCGTALKLATSMKCRDCHQVVHRNCCGKLHLPCIPRPKTLMTPKSAGRGGKTGTGEFRLQDFCTAAKPMIPSAVIHCVVALEARGLTQEGIYRVPGQTRTVTLLLDELRSKTVPNVALHDVEVITDTLKRFLRDLKDPLIPRTSRQELIAASNLYSTDPDNGRLALNRVICELPQANRDTLAYLFIHWRKVIAQSSRNKMNCEAMARMVAPAVMGHPIKQTQSQAIAGRDMQDCHRAITALFEFDDVYWQRFLGTTTTSIATNQIETARHESVALCDRSILGPVTTSPATPLLARSALATRNRGANLLGPMFHD